MDFLDPSNLFNPANPLSPFNPLSPLWDTENEKAAETKQPEVDRAEHNNHSPDHLSLMFFAILMLLIMFPPCFRHRSIPSKQVLREPLKGKVK